MRKTAQALLAALVFGFGAMAPAKSVLAAGGARNGTGGLPTADYASGWYGFYGKGPIYSGVYAPPAYDGYFVYDYPVYTGGDVTAVAVDLVNFRFRHRRVVGPGIVYYHSQYPRPYRMNPYW